MHFLLFKSLVGYQLIGRIPVAIFYWMLFDSDGIDRTTFNHWFFRSVCVLDVFTATRSSRDHKLHFLVRVLFNCVFHTQTNIYKLQRTRPGPRCWALVALVNEVNKLRFFLLWQAWPSLQITSISWRLERYKQVSFIPLKATMLQFAWRFARRDVVQFFYLFPVGVLITPKKVIVHPLRNRRTRTKHL